MNDSQRTTASVLSWVLVPGTMLAYGAAQLLYFARAMAGEQFATALTVLAGAATVATVACIAGFLTLRVHLMVTSLAGNSGARREANLPGPPAELPGPAV